ncbi:bifunctional D-cysteine desulfhydrase 1-aminocyclopropane-1-carboxylate mitochondrial-like [Brachionus plicatilis]|uniref:Bifunctional D-cysteine desulfhydrase 1-aminocyclopropane-1-carboxylate mitochondrial-like n=1 Tax=Brachionus plicatilis TaxID=10195 RepID=A0A3M7RNK2_BRAPC|nr:bifunctional D-cysteine desulfhydrase 1-aminocyclopropane-1-carboxylate mitochondrial-like [Brachionus plicatilis]
MKIFDYRAPKWLLEHSLAKNIRSLPQKRLRLLDKQETKIEKVGLNLQNGSFQMYIKRDDQSHNELHLQGNKLRKLEFLFAEALGKGAKHILTAGGLQSNHCRAVAGVSQLSGLKTHLFLRSDSNDASRLKINGNLLIDFLLGSKIYLVEKRAQYLTEIEYKMKILSEKIKVSSGDESYIIPIGGSNTTGLFGYLEQFDEMIKQNIDEFIDDIVVTSGSGGTMSALAIANYFTGSKFKLHSFCVCDSSTYFYNHLKQEIQDLLGSETKVDVKSMVNIVQCSRGLGYAKSTKEELEFLVDFFRNTGIALDPVYTGKAMYALVNLLNGQKPTLDYHNDENARNFLSNLKGNRILFIHTGGQLDKNRLSNK